MTSRPLPLPREQSGSSPQALLSALFADFALEETRGLSSTAIIRILDVFGVSESGARSALSRITARGLVAATRTGVDVRYNLGPWARDAHRERLAALVSFGAGSRAWDGRWTILVLSGPEADRAARRRRTIAFEEAGWGRVAEAAWIHPRVAVDDAHAFAAVHAASFAVTRGEGRLTDVDLAAAFRLDALRDAYDAFIARYEKVGEPMSGPDALRTRTALLRDWRHLGVIDPDLPDAVLPADWPRTTAYALFTRLRRAAASPALGYLRTLVDPDVTDALALAEPGL